jgi:hypothetical protein
MKHILMIAAGLTLALGLDACGRFGPHYPRAALDACRSPRALLAVRRAVFQQAIGQGASAALVGRLRREGRATLEDPEVQDYDRDTGEITCTALLRLQPPDPAAQEISSNVTYDADPVRAGVYHYKLTDPGQAVQAISSLSPSELKPEAPAASSAAAETAAQSSAPDDADAQTLQDAAAAGDTGRSHRPAPPPAPQPAAAAPH